MPKTSEEVAKELVEKTLRELSQKPRPKARSRVWQDPKGYQYLAVWQNAALLRVFVRKFTFTLPLKEGRLKAQMDDEARSVKRNIEEGWKWPKTLDLLRFLGYSQGSLEELKGDVRDCKTDGFLKSVPGSSLKDKGINLRVIKGPDKNRGQVYGEPTEPNHPYSKPLNALKGEDLTYEMFMELTNKTDWLLRKLVESLEKKLESDQKAYRIEQERIKGNLNPNP